MANLNPDTRAYRYTNEDGTPLLKCPTCGSALDAHDGVCVETVDNGAQTDFLTKFDGSGRVDPEGLAVVAIAAGRHSRTTCNSCGESLVDYESEVNESRDPSDDRGRLFVEFPSPACLTATPVVSHLLVLNAGGRPIMGIKPDRTLEFFDVTPQAAAEEFAKWVSYYLRESSAPLPPAAPPEPGPGPVAGGT